MHDIAATGSGRGWLCVLAVLLLASGGACSSSGDDGAGGRAGASGASSGATGGTASMQPELCGSSKCPAGQYCVAGTTCTPGCTSDDDCGQNQSCGDVDAVTHVGACKDLPVKDCDGFLKKCAACAGGDRCTQQVCDALSADCVNCVANASCDDSGACPCD